ncbi:MAG: hypothetical protein ACYC64_13065 [Armatimonadota bacterium]
MDNMRQNKRGTSLVEILVVMVVLLVGIMTVIQMFPTGFGVVKAAESRTIAARLGQQELERWKTMSANLPQGFLPIKEDGTFFADDAAYSNEIRNLCVLPGPPFGTFVVVGGVRQRGNVLNIRWVREETTPIPAPGYFSTGNGTTFGSQYTLAFSPIDVYEDNGGLNGLVVKSGPLKRVRSRSGRLRSIKQGQYLVSYESSNPSFYLAFPKDSPNIERFYYISYSYWAKNGNNDPVLLSVLNQRVPYDPDNPNLMLKGDDTDWVEVPLPTNAASGYDPIEVEPNTDICSRGFRMLDSAFSWPDDPYTFKLSDSILGVLAFNPSAQDLYEYTALGKRPVEARIDYRIYDPRILREDKVVPDAAPGAKDIPIKLALRFILNAGKPGEIDDGDPTDNPDEPTFEGLMRGTLVNGVARPQLGQELTAFEELIIPYSMLIVDLQTGLRVGVQGSGIPVDAIDYKTGVVHLPVYGSLIDYGGAIIADNVPLAGRNLRFFYRADGDWSVQCHKAYANYSRVYEATAVDYCHFCLAQTNRLLFAPCDAGKTVAVDYTYAASDDSGEHRVVGQACQISDYSDPTSGRYFLDLEVPVAAGQTYEIKRISVMGTSFTARVIWRDGKHWRHVDMDTSLVRGGG